MIGADGSLIKELKFPSIKGSYPFLMIDAQVGPKDTCIVMLGNRCGDIQILSISKELNGVETVIDCSSKSIHGANPNKPSTKFNALELNGKKIPVDPKIPLDDIYSFCLKDDQIIMAGRNCLIVVDPINSTVESNHIPFLFLEYVWFLRRIIQFFVELHTRVVFV